MKPPRRFLGLAVSIPAVALFASVPGFLHTPLASPLASPPLQPTAVLQPVPATVGDFKAPVSEQQAQQNVSKAQQADAARREQLNPTPPDGLPVVRSVYLDTSKHNLSDRFGFLTFWREEGALLTFGYPISEERVEDGRIVQYFERAKFEFHPGDAEPVQVALLGTQLTAGRSFDPGVAGTGERFFAETSHSLSGSFLQFWQKRGGLPIFGFPISEPFEEVSTIDGQVRMVQYFERAKFEYFPEELGSFYRAQVQNVGLRLAALREVQLADLGRQAALQHGIRTADQAAYKGAAAWSPKNYARRIDVNLSSQQLVAYEDDIPVFTAPVATGRDGFNTPTGTYAIYYKLPMQDMTGSMGGESWYVPNIPWVQYIVGGVAFHGTYWHDQWGTGTRMSHGCVNLNIDDAEWLYEWADIGTTVNISY